MLSILINAYACSPIKGSEPGMAWNWIINLANDCKLYVITEGEWEKEIEEKIKQQPNGKNITFYYNPVSDKIREMCWNQGTWKFYYYYRQWQKETLEIAKTIIAEHEIDLIHQLNMVGYREPGLLWKIDGIPKVWGPIGGFGGIPNNYLSLYSKRSAFKQIIKQIINTYQIHLPYINEPIHKVDELIACNSIAKNCLQKISNKNIPIISEVGAKKFNKTLTPKDYYSPTLKLAWVGKNDERKALSLAIKVLSELIELNIELNVYGISRNELNNEKLPKNIIFHGWLKHEQVENKLQHCHLLLFTSLFEATGTAVLEALSMGLPVLCHNTCGQGDIINNQCGYKVEMKSVEYSIDQFKSSIIELYHNRSLLQQLSKGAKQRVNELSWENNSKKMLNIYKRALNI